jgi:hypothetical protein
MRSFGTPVAESEAVLCLWPSVRAPSSHCSCDRKVVHVDDPVVADAARAQSVDSSPDAPSGKIIAMPSEQEAASLSVLKCVPIFSSLSEQKFAFLTSRLGQRRFSAGELIFGEGDPCAGLYIVQSGNVRIFKSSAGGREQVLSIDGPGSSIAEPPVFDGGSYPASGEGSDGCPVGYCARLPAQRPVGQFMIDFVMFRELDGLPCTAGSNAHPWRRH